MTSTMTRLLARDCSCAYDFHTPNCPTLAPPPPPPPPNPVFRSHH